MVGFPRSLKKNDALAPAPVDTNPKPASNVTSTATLFGPAWVTVIVPILGAPVEQPPPEQWSEVKTYVSACAAGTAAKASSPSPPATRYWGTLILLHSLFDFVFDSVRHHPFGTCVAKSTDEADVEVT